ncbi:flavin-containing monooxygenase [Solibacillus sp. FSL K6-1523]|uniref:flavin-containing monooxygenase n=1 Tax=Solibacillus sp. FSL K6-1523 TaxID=2921471 RepID=UPI0030FAC95C
MANHFDAIVIGAGFSGIYMTYKLREDGFTVKTLEKASGVGGVWNVARYPGAHCDSDSHCYNFMFSEDLYRKWSWSKRFAPQEEILRYLNFAADELDVKKQMQFHTEVTLANWDEDKARWHVLTSEGEEFTATYLISGVGCLSTSNIPNFDGSDNFEGDSYHTGAWPSTPVDLKGKRIGVIGTGSSGVQSIPVIAQEAGELYVFQRTPQYTVPARNRELTEEEIAQLKEDYTDIREKIFASHAGYPFVRSTKSAAGTPEEERLAILEDAWEKGSLSFGTSFNDIAINTESNEIVSEFLRGKIRETVKDPETAKSLLPYYYYTTKRPIIDTNYHETYNKEHVTLVNLKEQPIVGITKNGIQTTEKEYPLDVIVYATGYDAMTGTLLKLNIKGRDGVSLKEKWANGANVETYLGLGVSGFPNFFTITGPQSPSVLTNMPSSIEQHVEWISDCLNYMKKNQIKTIEPTKEAEQQWSKQCMEIANSTLFTKTDSWYTGSNIEGKPRGFLIFLGGLDKYRQICNEIAEKGYEGYELKTTEAIK